MSAEMKASVRWNSGRVLEMPAVKAIIVAGRLEDGRFVTSVDCSADLRRGEEMMQLFAAVVNNLLNDAVECGGDREMVRQWLREQVDVGVNAGIAGDGGAGQKIVL